jgi:hypothetical protein
MQQNTAHSYDESKLNVQLKTRTLDEPNNSPRNGGTIMRYATNICQSWDESWLG